MPFDYIAKPLDKLRNNYNERKRELKNGFASFEDFVAWYNEQDKVCHYCGLTEAETQQIVLTGVLTSNRFPQAGIIGRGTSRGVWLEVDRPNPRGLYSRDNAVLCCYFCNNDKSDVFSAAAYREFTRDRVGYLRRLLAAAPPAPTVAEQAQLEP